MNSRPPSPVRRPSLSRTAIRVFALIAMATAATPATAQRFLRPADINALPSKPADARIAYGTDSLQFGELRLPPGKGPFPVAIVLHGGCWVHAFASAQNSAALADALRDAGVATWNVEYRRRDDAGGGWPGTFQDVANAADSLRSVARRFPLDLTRVVAVGHSAGGHLALWLAARHRFPVASPLYSVDPLPIAGVVSLAGPGDLRDFDSYGDAMCGEGTIPRLLGGRYEEVGDRWREASPSTWLPLGVPQVMIAGEFDRIMPKGNLERWQHMASEAGDRVEVEIIPGASHHEVMSPASVTWPAVRAAVLRLLGSTPAREPAK